MLDKSVVVIQGLSGADDLKNVTERQFIPDFKNKKLVTMAIRDPLKSSSRSERKFVWPQIFLTNICSNGENVPK